MSVLKHNFTHIKSCIDPLTVILSKFSGFHEYKFQSQTISHAIGKISTVNLWWSQSTLGMKYSLNQEKFIELVYSQYFQLMWGWLWVNFQWWFFLWIVQMFLSWSCCYFFHSVIIWCFYSVILIHVHVWRLTVK